jgi:penicillin amidase
MFWRAPFLPTTPAPPLAVDAEVSVLRDEHGVPRITAPCFSALAFGQGFCHAADRLVQCAMLRIVARGRLSELLADNDETVEIDSFFRGMRFAEDAEAEAAEMQRRAAAPGGDGAAPSAAARLWEFLTSYCAGFNKVLAEHRRPVEFIALGVKPEPWTPADIVLTVKAMSYIGLAQAQEVLAICVESGKKKML